MTHALTIAQALLGCLQTALSAPHVAPIAPEHVMLRGGGEVTPLLGKLDDECCRGLGWVRITGKSGLREVNDPTGNGLDGCFRTRRTLTLELGTARCAPSAPVSGVPTEDQWAQAVTVMDADDGAMEQAVCCLAAMRNDLFIGDLAVGDYTPFGVDGNCLGATLLLTIATNACC
ncbi:hypothetical protein ACIGBL_33325 [Streptomyces sp. NPDC085614]|uniref:hypothetical protein n=1 Tax=Streptomyces sp. NPDC085614 TaxID=3365733 RepID=UPI0037D9043F